MKRKDFLYFLNPGKFKEGLSQLYFQSLTEAAEGADGMALKSTLESTSEVSVRRLRNDL